MFSLWVFFFDIRSMKYGALWNHSFAVNQFWLILPFWPLKNMIDFLHSSLIQKDTTKTHNIIFRNINKSHWHMVETLSLFCFDQMERIDFALRIRTWNIHIHVVSLRQLAIFSFNFPFLCLFEFDVFRFLWANSEQWKKKQICEARAWNNTIVFLSVCNKARSFFD